MPHLEGLNIKHDQAMISIGHTLVTVGLGMFSIFQPLYLYQNGVPILSIVGYEIFFWTFSVFAVIPSFYVASRFGVRCSLIASWIVRLVLLAYLASLGFLIENYNIFLILFVLGIINRVASGLYWMPFHCLFAQTFDGEHEARGLGRFQALGRVSAIMTPIVGATLLITLSPYAFFAVIGTIFSVGIFSFLRTDLPEKSFMRTSTQKIFHQCMQKENLPYFTEGIVGRAQFFVWPLLLGLREISLAAMGALFTATNLLRTVICVIIGNSLDRHAEWVRLIQSIGMAVMSVSFFMRGFFFNIFFAGIGQSLGGVGQTVYNMPTAASMYLKANPSDITTPIAVREILLNIGRAVMSIIAFVLVLIYEGIIGLSAALFISGLWCGFRSLQFFVMKYVKS